MLGKPGQSALFKMSRKMTLPKSDECLTRIGVFRGEHVASDPKFRTMGGAIAARVRGELLPLGLQEVLDQMGGWKSGLDGTRG